MNPRKIVLALLLAVPAAITAESMIGEVLAKTPSLSMLHKLYQVDRYLFDVLEDPVDLTYFAPSDEAMTEFLRTTRKSTTRSGWIPLVLTISSGGSSDYLTNKATRYRIFKDIFYYMFVFPHLHPVPLDFRSR